MNNKSPITNSTVPSTPRSGFLSKALAGVKGKLKSWILDGEGVGLIVFKDGSAKQLFRAKPIQWSEDMRFATIKHRDGSLVVHHQHIKRFQLTVVPAGKARVQILEEGF